MSVSYYDILNVPYTASIEEIRYSFRKMAKLYHPDISLSDNANSKFKLIIKAYKILGNEESKRKYDDLYLKNNVIFDGNNSYIKISKSRLNYASSLKTLAESGLLSQKKFKRKHRLNNFGYDISILITPYENKRGIAITLSIPSKIACYVCYGANHTCYLCDGLGIYSSVEELEVIIPSNVEHKSIVDIDLSNYKPRKLTYFTLSNIRLLINILGK